MPLIDTSILPVREPKPGWHGRFFDGEAMSFAYYDLASGATLHEHSHANEEVWNVIAGELEITIGAELFRAGPGSAALVPAHTAHSIRVIADSTVIVVDTPLRGAIGGGERAAFAIQFDAFALPALGFEVRNHGRAAGVLQRLDIESGVAPHLPAARRTEIPAGELPERMTIPGGGAHRAAHEHGPLTSAQIEQLCAGTAVFYVRGVILYADADGLRHHCTFCRVLGAGQELVAPPQPGYNYGD